MVLCPRTDFSCLKTPASVNSSINRGISCLDLMCNRTGWAQPCWNAGDFPAPGSHKQTTKRLIASACNLQLTFNLDGPIKHATVGRMLASKISLVVLLAWLKVSSYSHTGSGLISFHGIEFSFPSFRTEATSLAVRDRFAAGVVNDEAISKVTCNYFGK